MKLIKLTSIALTILPGFLFVIPLSGQSLDDLLQMSISELANVEVVTASKTLRPSRDITQKVDVITQQQINQTVSGNRNISELTQYLPGASVKALSRNHPNWGAYGGIGPKYNTYMVQGLPVDAFMDPMNIEVMAISRIEVQRGPASVLYPNYLSQDFAGNQSPLAGTANLILKEVVDKAETMASLAYGSNNTYTGQAYHQNRFKRLNYLGGASFEQSDYANYGSENSWLNMLKSPEYKKVKAFAGANFFLDKSSKHKVTFYANQALNWGDEGRVNRDFDHKYSLVNAAYFGQLGLNLAISFKTGLRLYNRSWSEDDSLYLLKESKDVEQRIIPVDFSISFNHYNNSNLTLGADYQQSAYHTWLHPQNGNKQTGNDASASQAGIYIQEELQLNKFTLRGGSRFNFIHYDISKLGGNTPGATSQSWDAMLWSAGAKYRLTREVVLFANGGNSFISPGLKSIGGTLPLSDKYVSGRNGQLPNPDLEPEYGTSFDMGFDYSLPVNICLSARAFYTVIKDAIIDTDISQDSSHSQTISINTDGKTIGKGFEFSLRQKLDHKVDWFINTTFTHSTIESPNNADQDGVEVPFVPEMLNNLGVTFYLPYNIELSPWFHFGGSIFDSNSKMGRHLFNSNELLNVHIQKTFEFKSKRQLNVFAKAYNITDNEFEMPWQFQDPGFSLSAGTRLVF